MTENDETLSSLSLAVVNLSVALVQLQQEVKQIGEFKSLANRVIGMDKAIGQVLSAMNSRLDKVDPPQLPKEPVVA